MIPPAAPAHRLAQADPPPAADSPAYYVPVPRRLVEDLRDAPVAIGAYALVARAYRAAQAAVPLSPADLMAFDPALSYGAATRALQRLVAAGYLLATRSRQGAKAAYTPTWGMVRAQPAPWQLDAPSLGRPRHIAALRLEQRLLDTCMGRVRPHPTHPALVERYLPEPLLGLRDIGAYLLAAIGLPCPSDTLARLGLIRDGAPQPLPDDATLLAVASQRASLTDKGWEKLGLRITSQEAEPAATPLFFVPPGQIAESIAGVIDRVIADSIGTDVPGEGPPSPSGCAKAPSPSEGLGSHGVHGADRVHPTTTPQGPTGQGGGGALASSERPGTETRASGDNLPPPASPAPTVAAAPPTETERQLLGIGVRREVARALADRPAALVAQVIAQTTARPGVRDRAAWVVSALRAIPDAPADAPALPPPSPMPIYTHPALADEQRDRWIRRFHAATGPAEKRAVLARMAQEHPLPDGDDRRLPAGSDAPPDRGPAPATPG